MIRVSRIVDYLSIWNSLTDKLGPFIFSVIKKYTPERKKHLFTLIENLPGSNIFVLNIFDSSWRASSVIDELRQHANKYSVGLVMKDCESFSTVNTPFLYLKIDIDDWPDIEKIISKIPTHVNEVYFCLIGTDKIMLLKKLKKLVPLQYT